MAKRASAAEAQASKLQLQERKLREVVSSALEVAAKKAEWTIRTESLSYVAGEHIFAANVLTEDIADFRIDHLRNGSVLMFIYLAVPTGATLKPSGQSLPSGFYAVKVSGTARKVSAQLLDSTGGEVADCPATITTARSGKGSPVAEDKTSASVKGGGKGNLFGCVTVDVSGSKLGVKFNIKVTLCF
jgi:hypothetical protein